MRNIMAIWAGYALGGKGPGGHAVPEDDLGPYIEQARQQVRGITALFRDTTDTPIKIEFAVGDRSTPNGT